jgi:hypothetical protein
MSLQAALVFSGCGTQGVVVVVVDAAAVVVVDAPLVDVVDAPVVVDPAAAVEVVLGAVVFGDVLGVVVVVVVVTVVVDELVVGSVVLVVVVVVGRVQSFRQPSLSSALPSSHSSQGCTIPSPQ